MTRKGKYRRLPVIRVNWVDAYGRTGWHDNPKKGERIPQHLCPGVGILVGEDEHSIVLSPVADAEEHVNEFVILKANIRGKRKRIDTIVVPEDN
jgi:hypothetical protein